MTYPFFLNVVDSFIISFLPTKRKLRLDFEAVVQGTNIRVSTIGVAPVHGRFSREWAEFSTVSGVELSGQLIRR